jgi:CHRD domain
MSKIHRIAPLARKAVLSLALVAPLAFAGHLNTLLNAQLDGRQEVDTSGNNAMVGDPRGRGEFYAFGIDANLDTLCYNLQAKRIGELELAPLAGVRMAHIHAGKRGENGPVVANLAWPQDGQAADCLTEGEAGKFPTNEAGIVQRILQNPKGFYINVHNTEYPAGAIRGQLADTAGHKH